jgi:hypothetical protein
MSKFGSKEKCHKCGKTVYLMEKVTVEGKATQIFHNYCFRCSVCNKVVTLANYVSLEDQIFCKTHYLAELHARKSKAQNSGSTSNGQDGQQDEEQEEDGGEQQEQQDNGNSEPQEQTNEKSGYSDEDNDDEY